MKASILLFVLLAPISFACAQEGGRYTRWATMQKVQEEATRGSTVNEFQVIQAEAERHPDSPAYRFQTVNSVELRRDANELANLAQSIPPDVEQTTKGLFPKDLIQKLKQIEKLSKRLRTGISP